MLLNQRKTLKFRCKRINTTLTLKGNVVQTTKPTLKIEVLANNIRRGADQLCAFEQHYPDKHRPFGSTETI